MYPSTSENSSSTCSRWTRNAIAYGFVPAVGTAFTMWAVAYPIIHAATTDMENPNNVREDAIYATSAVVWFGFLNVMHKSVTGSTFVGQAWKSGKECVGNISQTVRGFCAPSTGPSRETDSLVINDGNAAEQGKSTCCLPSATHN
jgi:hypothetical protein